MADETTTNPAPADTAIPQAPETSISTPPEAIIVPAPAEAPTEPVPETPSGHLGGNDPIESAPAQEETPTETTQPIPIEKVIETVPEPITVETPTPAQTQIEATSVTPVETFAPAPVTQAPTPAQVVATAVAPVVATLNSSRLGVSGEASAMRIEASPQAALAENINSQTFIKSMRELFTKALNARQNKKRKKLDRILSLFAKQTMITNNEVEKLLHVSDSTATRYLTTLTKEGKLKQNTKKGQATSYSKI